MEKFPVRGEDPAVYSTSAVTVMVRCRGLWSLCAPVGFLLESLSRALQLGYKTQDLLLLLRYLKFYTLLLLACTIFFFLLVPKRICGCSTLCFCTGRARVSARYVFSKKFSSPAVALLNSNISIYCYYYCCCCCCYILLEHFRSFKLTKGEMAKVGKPRLCVMTKGENGYGFHLHGEKGKSGQFIRKVEAGSPAEASGLRAGDRLVAVNGVNVEKETHHQASRCVYYLTCVLAGWAGATSTGDTGWCRHPDTVAHSLLLHSASQTRGLQVIELQNILFGNKGRAEQELYAGCIPSLAVFFPSEIQQISKSLVSGLSLNINRSL